jgi:hypothetical protein
MDGRKLAGLMPPAASVAASGIFASSLYVVGGVQAARSRAEDHDASMFTRLQA